MVKTRRMCNAINSSQSRSSGISDAILFVYKKCWCTKMYFYSNCRYSLM